MDRTAHGRVEQGTENAAVDRTDGIVEVLTDVEVEGHPARLDRANAHAEQGRHRRPGDASVGNRPQIVDSAHLVGESSADERVLPRDLQPAIWIRDGGCAGDHASTSAERASCMGSKLTTGVVSGGTDAPILIPAGMNRQARRAPAMATPKPTRDDTSRPRMKAALAAPLTLWASPGGNDPAAPRAEPTESKALADTAAGRWAPAKAWAALCR